jgi:hypothetical protein
MLNVLTEKEVEAEVSRPVATDTEFKRMRAWLDERVKRAKKERFAEVVTLTPCLASLLLERNPINRPIGRYNSEMLKADIANGRFLFNGETIVISNTGVLLDGQHRCTVVIETRMQIETTLVFGPVEDARYTIDIGKPKSAANFLHMKGHADTNNVSAMLSLLILYSKFGHVDRHTQRPTKTEIVAAAERYRGLDISLDVVAGATREKLGGRSILAFCHYVFKRKAGAEAADEFMRLLIDNDGLRKGSAIHTCRKKLQSMERGFRVQDRCEVLFKAWNAWRQDANVSSFRCTGTLPKLEN